MSEITQPRPPRPYPTPTETSRPFWDAAREGRLLYQTGVDDDRPIFPPQAFSPYDLSTDLVWRESAGRGTVYSYTVVWRPQTAAFDVPYIVAIIELDEGYTMLSNIVNAEPDRVAVGARVAVEYLEVLPGQWAPVFALRDDSAE